MNNEFTYSIVMQLNDFSGDRYKITKLLVTEMLEVVLLQNYSWSDA
jgi:hypothetical protein